MTGSGKHAKFVNKNASLDEATFKMPTSKTPHAKHSHTDKTLK